MDDRPLISNIPKLGWKCKNCRVCGDCGSRTPGSGPSSRWHSCFTVCDSCYQQRNKGVSCPMCGKAYRHSQREMSQCQRCRKYVHSGCDPEADRSLVQRKKDMNPDYEYLCPPCKDDNGPINSMPANMKIKLESDLSNDNSSAALAAQAVSNFFGDTDSNSNGSALQQQQLPPPPLPPPIQQQQQPQQLSQQLSQPSSELAVDVKENQRGQKVIQQSAGKIARKRMGGPTSSAGAGAGGRPKGSGKASAFSAAVAGSGGAAYNRKTSKLSDFGRKRGPKPKMSRGFGGSGSGQSSLGSGTGGSSGNANASSGNTTAIGTTTGEGEPCLENKLILCASSDGFVVEQDACAMCGSFGLDMEGRLISCAQCGQCYHPFCANVKVTKVILQKGWRCLDW